jgi:hypothetical protein
MSADPVLLDEAAARRELAAVVETRRRIAERRSELAAERVQLEHGLGLLAFEAIDSPQAKGGLEKRRQRLGEIGVALNELGAADQVGGEREVEARGALDRCRRLAAIEAAKAVGPGLIALGEALDRSAAEYGRNYGALSEAIEKFTRNVAAAIPDRNQAGDFAAGLDDAGRLASLAKMYAQRHGGPETRDESGIPFPASSRADAPSPGAVTRERVGYLMGFLDTLAARIEAGEEAPSGEAPGPVARDDVHGLVLQPGPADPEPADPAPVFGAPAAPAWQAGPALPPPPAEAIDADAARAARADAGVDLNEPGPPLSEADRQALVDAARTAARP